MAGKVRRGALVTIRVTELELIEVKRLAYLRKTTVAKLFRAFVTRELAEEDKDLQVRLHGPRNAARAKVVPLRRVTR